MIKRIQLLTLFFVTTIYSQSQKKATFPIFLEGTWKVENKETYEEWEMLAANEFMGQGYKIKDGKKIVSENLAINKYENEIIYTATVLNQNQGKGINFTLNQVDENTYSFENLNHDFPQKIIYQKVNDGKVYVQLLGKNGKGFSFHMFKIKMDIPKWLTQEWAYLTNDTGRWITENKEYVSENEPYEQYGLEWKYGLGKKSIEGKLYGIIDGKNVGTFWEFRTFWHPGEKKAFTQQFGSDGTYGIGELSINDGEMIKMLQTFYPPNGLTYKVGHETTTNAIEHKTTSYQIDEAGKWHKNRTYVWKPILIDETAKSQIDTLQSGELMLKQDIIINTKLDRVWKAFSEPEEWKKWVTPVVEMDFKINGTIKSNYEPTAKIGDKGTITNHILSYIPKKNIVMQAEIAENFPEFMKGEEKNMYAIFDFEPINENQTKVTIYGVGYKNEKRWQDLLKFFIQGNELSLNSLKKYLEQK